MRPPRVRLVAILWLTVTVFLVGAVRVTGPTAGLDPGWAAGLNLAREVGIRHGRELVFTFGPWGFLDVPLVTTRPDFVLGLAFSVGSVVAAWLLILAVLRSKLSARMALPAASLVTITVASVSSPSFLLAAVADVICVRHLRQIPTLSTAWGPTSVAGLAALLLQIKFSEGVAVAVLALMTCLASPRARLKRTANSAVLCLVTFLLLWVAAGQSVSEIGPWLRASANFVTGYTSAMSQESFAAIATLATYLMAALLVIGVLVVGWSRPVERSVVSHAGSLVVIAGALSFGFKQSFTRHDAAHSAALFVVASLLLCLLLERGPQWRATVMLIALSSLTASPALSTYVRGNPFDSWVSTVRILTNDHARLAILDQGRSADVAEYGLPVAMVEATHGQTVSVDPWEVSMVWAYSMKWRPMPVFQSYSAYTTHLDQLSAQAASRAGDDQMIIRATTVSTFERPTSIDSRNPMWESPRYTLAVVCNYSLVTANQRWMLLRKSVSRCGDPSPSTTARQVSANELVSVPRAAAHEIVVASFVPTNANPFVTLAHVVFKDPEPLMASVDGERFRLPEGLASGPLLTVLPATLDWPAEFRGHTFARSLSFSRSGTVQFSTIQLTG